jgi:hypothetical protein
MDPNREASKELLGHMGQICGNGSTQTATFKDVSHITNAFPLLSQLQLLYMIWHLTLLGW